MSLSLSLSPLLSKYSTVKHVNVIAVILVIFVATLPLETSALRCYTCSMADGQVDKTCLEDVESARQTDCTKKYCTIMRQDRVKPSGSVVSFIRDCLDKPLYLNAVKTDPTFKTYYRSCTEDLCNDSDGTHSATNVDPNFGAAENSIIIGKSAAVQQLMRMSCGALLGVGGILHWVMKLNFW